MANDLASAHDRFLERKLVLLAPQQALLPRSFVHISPDTHAYYDLLARMQRFRGKGDSKADQESWHVLLLDTAGTIGGCCRYTEYQPETEFSRMSIGRSPAAHSQTMGEALRTAVDNARRQALLLHTSFVELGGWAIAEGLRHSPDAVRLTLAIYALARHLRGGVGVTHAMAGSGASIFRKISGPAIVRYFDADSGSEMEFGRFDSEAPGALFGRWIQQLSQALSSTEVITARRRHDE